MPQLPITTIVHQSPPDQASAERFLKALDPTAKSFLFVIIKQDKVAVRRHERTQQLYDSMAFANGQQYNIYVTINETNKGEGTTRQRDEVTRFTCVFADDDGKEVAKPYPIEPSAVIETSLGKKQVYWFLSSQPPSIDEWDSVQQTLVNDYAGDIQARDAARILRLPGYYNVKPEYPVPHRVRIVSISDKRYTWGDIKQAFPPSQVVTATGGIKGETIDLRAVLEQAATGTNYHQANITLAGWYYNTGITDRDKLINILQAQIDVYGNPADARFDHRRNVDIPGSVDWIIKERDKEQQPEHLEFTSEETTTSNHEYTRLPIPGGGLFNVMQWVKSIMRYPNDSIALIVAEHLVSVFGGGHYHIMNNTTTRKRIVLAPLAAGKNTITRAMGLVVRGLGQLNGEGIPWVMSAEDFVGSDSFSFSVQHKQLEQHRVRSFVVNEAGESGRTQAGDVGTLRAYQLQALSTKADELFIPKKFSEQGKGQEDKQLKTVYNGVWVYFHESTIRSYAEVLTQSSAFVNGDLSRSDIFFVDPTIKEVNHNMQGLTQDILVYFANLANDFRKLPGHQGAEDHAIWEEVDTTEIRSRLDDMEREIMNARNKAYKQSNDVDIALLGRRFERILTTVLICAVADAGGTQIPVARSHHLEYAIRRADAIDKTLRYHSRGGGQLGDDVLQSLQEYFVKRFKDMISTMTARKAARYQMKPNNIPLTYGGDSGWHWTVNLTTITAALRHHTFNAFTDVHRGDTKRARKELMSELVDRGIVRPVVEKQGDEFKLLRPLKWWLNQHLFHVDPKHTRIKQ